MRSTNIIIFLTCCLTFVSGLFDASAREERQKCLPAHRVKAGLDWVDRNYVAADGRAPDYVDKFIGENTTIFFASNPPTRGRETIRTFLNWQWGATNSITHTLEEVFIFEDLTIIQTTATYNFKDGVSLDGSAYTVQVKAPEDPYPSEIRIYGDFTAVFAKFIEVAGPPPSL